jgi:membrane peptidoglycan carboxypeptidase
VLLAVLIVLLAGVGMFLYLWEQPLPRPLPEPAATVVYDASGQPLATFSEQYRVDVPLKQVPKVVIDAVVSTEDRHYFTEGAINPTSIVRAAFDDLTGHGGLQGGSTITQQYVKQAYVGAQRTLLRKAKEAVVAIKISHKYSKQQILGKYLNVIYWGRGAYGIEAASRAYFGKDVSQLSLREASLLAGLIREPETADPARDPGLARQNQTDTLKAMVRDKKITEAQAVAVENTPFSAYVLPPPSAVSKTESSTMGDDYFIAAVRQELYAKYGRAAVDGGGLHVTTTFDPKLQRDAYGALYGKGPHALNPAAGDPSAALVSMDDNGQVRALVGGQDYSKSTVDLALGAAGGGSGRQAGSTFKAMMLAEFLKQGYSVQSQVPAPPKVVLNGGNGGAAPWVVTNYEGEAVAPKMSVTDATALSVNTVYAQIVARIGADNLDTMAKAMGISAAELRGAYPSQVLGSADVSPLEMAGAFATLADGGVYHTPILITAVSDAKGRPLPLPVQPQTRTVLTPAQAATETYVLQQVVQRGTGVAAGGLSSPVAGKTGTTQNAGDAWFVGYTAKLTTSLWMGYANSDKSMDGFRGMTSVAGGTIPAQMWHNYMASALAQEPQYGGSFPAPDLGGKPFQPWPLQGDQIMVGNAAPVPTTSASWSPSTSPWTSPSPSSTSPSTTVSTTTLPQQAPTTRPTPSTAPPPPPPPTYNTTTSTSSPPASSTTTTSTTVAGNSSGGGTTTTVPASG